MSNLYALPKDMLIKLITTISEDYEKKIEILEKKLKYVTSTEEIYITNCEQCDKWIVDGDSCELVPEELEQPHFFQCLCKKNLCKTCAIKNEWVHLKYFFSARCPECKLI